MKAIYKTKQLMCEKYGEDRFALACEIVSRWLLFYTKKKVYDSIWVERMCNAHKYSEIELTHEVAEALRKLFGLKSYEELFISCSVRIFKPKTIKPEGLLLRKAQ